MSLITTLGGKWLSEYSNPLSEGILDLGDIGNSENFRIRYIQKYKKDVLPETTHGDDSNPCNVFSMQRDSVDMPVYMWKQSVYTERTVVGEGGGGSDDPSGRVKPFLCLLPASQSPSGPPGGDICRSTPRVPHLAPKIGTSLGAECWCSFDKMLAEVQ